MVISHSKKFIFIHIYKVAGTSIATALRKYNYLPSKLNRLKAHLGIYPKIYSKDFDGHITASELRKAIPVYFNRYFKFAFVRNPWDWQVSLYHFAKQTPEHHQHDLTRRMSFEEYIDWRVHEDLHLQKDFVCDEEGNLIVDFIGKIEFIQEDFNSVCVKIQMPTSDLGKKNNSIHKPYREYYNSTTREMVANAFKEDIQLFKYNF